MNKTELQNLFSTFKEIPFENSFFQNEFFVLAAQYTPARAYRAICLRLFNKLQALNEYTFRQKRAEVDRDEKRLLLENETNPFKRRRLQIDLDELEANALWTDKLVADCMQDVEHLLRIHKQFPVYTREQFELEEHDHFLLRLTRQDALGTPGAKESLLNIEHDMPALQQMCLEGVGKYLEAQKQKMLKDST